MHEYGPTSFASVPQDGDEVYTVVFNDPCQLLNALEPELAKRAKESNIVYAHAYKLSHLKRTKQTIAPNQFWIACYSRHRRHQSSLPTLNFVLSCTEGLLGSYPVFIYSNHPASQCSSRSFLEPRMSALAQTLADLVPPSRIFSVFSLVAVTRSFAAQWSQRTGARLVSGDPWYSATSSFCTRSTFREARTLSEPDHVLRRATMQDVEQCTTLCQEFAATSPPFTLNRSQARREAEELIRNRQLWVYQLPAHPLRSANSDSKPSGSSTASPSPSSSAISTIVAVTRSTPTVSAITKVYTTDAYRKRGCAERLVAHVTQELLEQDPDHTVVLYVGHTLDAVRVYDRIGFVGLDPASSAKADSVEDWLELGFQGTEIGHW